MGDTIVDKVSRNALIAKKRGEWDERVAGLRAQTTMRCPSFVFFGGALSFFAAAACFFLFFCLPDSAFVTTPVAFALIAVPFALYVVVAFRNPGVVDECAANLSAKHCRECNRWVVDFDHHCVWINNDVGANNRLWFVAFVLTVCLLCVVGASVCAHIAYAKYAHTYAVIEQRLPPAQFADVWRTNVLLLSLVFGGGAPSFGLALVLFVLSLVLTPFAAFHIFLLSTGQTTYSWLKGHRAGAKQD